MSETTIKQLIERLERAEGPAYALDCAIADFLSGPDEWILGAPCQWHRWFAWHPVWLTGEGQKVWLEQIERRWVGGFAGWHYRTRR